MTDHKLARYQLQFVVLILALFLSGQMCFAQESAGANPFASLPKGAIKKVPRAVEIYQYDESPLGSRKPLLLVHGLLGEYHPHFRWDQLAKYLTENQSFQNQYKIYLARFNTRLSRQEINNNFKDALPKLAPNGGLSIITISLSGIYVRSAMQDPEVNKCISRVIAMGPLFRGSPLFCADWMKETIKKRYLSPLSQIDRILAYKLYFSRHKNLLRYYAWDNADGQMILSKKARIKPVVLTSSVTPEQQKAIDHKFVVYTGYLHNQFAPFKESAIKVFFLTPFSFVRTTLPMHLDREHPALRFLNHMIAGAVPKTLPAEDIIYPLNDGISPISSGLLLTDEFASRTDFYKLKDLGIIRDNTNAGKARIFDDADHLTFIERNRPIGSSEKITDKLSLNEEPRHMFDWVIKDLME